MSKPTKNNEGMGLYIHIPFCVSKCGYCDFLSFEGKDDSLQRRYVEALIAEIQAANNRTTEIDTVYIGGGTPTALPTHLLCEILHEVKHFNLTKDAEITVEMNPCTAPHSVLPDLKTCGVNRLSIGLQAWQDDLLATIGRAHTTQDFVSTMEAARAAGFDNINVDLMFGLPGQTQRHWQESIAQVAAFAPEHISAYSLTPAEDTLLWDALEAGKIQLPDESADRKMYHQAISLLAAAGYEHYELSNFAKPGRRSRHNVNCWLRKPYLGLGLGAHSFDGAARWNNTEDMGQYLSSPLLNIIENHQQLSIQDTMSETMFLGLRLTKGISLQDFHNRFGKPLTDYYGPKLEMLTAKGLLAYKDGCIALTPLGLDLANQVFEAFL